jgi:hypothetical protein
MTAKRPSPQDGNPIKRRSLLQGMGGVAAAVLGASVARADAAAQTAQPKATAAPETDGVKPSGYHLTEHIRAYYRTTRL